MRRISFKICLCFLICVLFINNVTNAQSIPKKPLTNTVVHASKDAWLEITSVEPLPGQFVIIACYDINGQLIKTVTIQQPTTSNLGALSAQVLIPREVNFVKIFVWDINSLRPMGICEKCYIADTIIEPDKPSGGDDITDTGTGSDEPGNEDTDDDADTDADFEL